MDSEMSLCEHCQGQRFDRAQVLRRLRQVRKDLREKRRGRSADLALVLALNAVRDLEIPHLDGEEDEEGGEIIH